MKGYVSYVIHKKLRMKFILFANVTCIMISEKLYRTVEHKLTDFYMYDNKDKYIFLIQKEWKILGNYLVEAWSERAHKLYI